LRSTWLALALAGAATHLAAQQLEATEADAGAAAVLAHHDFIGAALGIARRTSPQSRLAVWAAGGASGGAAAVRIEASLQFLVTPGARTGVSPYGGMGVAYLGAATRHGQGVMVLLLGLEAAAGQRRGWFGEVGLGGGTRLRVGWRWRWFPTWWS